MPAKPGRNEPCHCGSGKKYKHCHEAADQARERAERSLKTIGQWLSFQLSALEARLEPALLAAAGDDPALRQVALFDAPGADNPPIASAPNGDDADELVQLATALAASHVSVHECIECKRGRGVRLRDRLTGNERFVWDPDLGSEVEPLEYLVGRVFMVGDRAVIAPGYEKVWFRGRKAAVAGLTDQLTAAVGEDPAQRTAWLKQHGAQTIERARAARPAS